MEGFRNGQWVLVDTAGFGHRIKDPNMPGRQMTFETEVGMAVMGDRNPYGGEKVDHAIGICVGPPTHLGDRNAEGFSAAVFREVHLVHPETGETWLVLPQCPVGSLQPARFEDIPEGRRPTVPHPRYPDAEARKRLAEGRAVYHIWAPAAARINHFDEEQDPGLPNLRPSGWTPDQEKPDETPRVPRRSR
jgi:hypothetical protein